nr:TetR/AcrR family transcriptional regulator [uncultured Methanospirillum sp.]
MGIAERRKREKEQRRTDILDAAQKLFFSRSFEDVSMDEIAREVELNKATLYLYFKNKEDLYATIVLRGIEILKAKYTQCMDTDAPGIVKVALMGQAFFEFSQEHPDYLRMIHFYGSERFSKENPCNADIGKGYGICRLILRDAVQQGIDDGSIRSDLDPFLTSMYLMISFMNNLSMESKWKQVIEAEGFSFNQYASEIFRFIIPSIISRKQASNLDIRDFARYGFNVVDPVPVKKR